MSHGKSHAKTYKKWIGMVLTGFSLIALITFEIGCQRGPEVDDDGGGDVTVSDAFDAGSQGAKPRWTEPNINTLAVREDLLEGVVSLPAEGRLITVDTLDWQDEVGAPNVWKPLTLDQAMRALDERGDWEHHFPPVDVPRHPAEQFLAGLVIVLDPGHGGKGLEHPTYKAGPTGVREAEMNLSVAKLLRRMLEDAGAEVILTREVEFNDIADDRLEDTHARRANVANTAPRPDGGVGADLFISIHHNASSNPDRNFTSIWTHGEAHWNGRALDAARLLAHRIGADLRTQVALTSPLMSDQQMYESGFAVLRHSRVPAVLLESSFFSNPLEEQRLRDHGYLLREAYAIYSALCEWAYNGLPTQSEPTLIRDDRGLVLITTLEDGLPGDWWGGDRLRILPQTVAVTVDGERVEHVFDEETQTLTAVLPVRDATSFQVTIDHQNFLKASNHPRRYAVSVDGTVEVRAPQRVGEEAD